MLELAYTISSELRNHLGLAESARQQILLSPLSPKQELKLKWNATVERAYGSCVLQQLPVSKSEVVKALMGEKKKKQVWEREIENFRRAFDFIKENWWVNVKPVTSRVVWSLWEALAWRENMVRRVFNQREQEIKILLEYLQDRTEHPLIQAGIVYSQINGLQIWEDKNETMARLLAYLFLYRQGWDVREMLVLEEPWRKDIDLWARARETAKEDKNYNYWLLFFVQGVTGWLDRVAGEIAKGQMASEAPAAYFGLNERQREILAILEQPDMVVTNSQVRRRFKISQITASRDLAKLLSLGLVFSHGRGRSVYYTRV